MLLKYRNMYDPSQNQYQEIIVYLDANKPSDRWELADSPQEKGTNPRKVKIKTSTEHAKALPAHSGSRDLRFAQCRMRRGGAVDAFRSNLLLVGLLPCDVRCVHSSVRHGHGIVHGCETKAKSAPKLIWASIQWSGTKGTFVVARRSLSGKCRLG
jgi:hypothetical protein